jgi:RNA polymerase sigma-70 factor, ECF subfamily
MEDADDELLARAARGDGVAFSRLVALHRAKLIALAARIVGNRAIAEEIVQEVFTRAWIHAPRWRPQGGGRANFAGWLARVATNLAIDQTRRMRSVPLDTAPEPVDMSLSAEQQLVADDDRRRLEAALAALPPRQRAAIALTYDQELSNAAGAEAMAISVGAFELLLVRARRALRQAMMEDKAR